MPDYFRMSVSDVLHELGTGAELGLTQQAALERQQQYGKNTLPSGEQATVWQILLNQFKNIMVIILIIAAVISGLLGDLNDVFVILVIVVLNALLGTYQEYRAEQALASLSALQVPLVRVRRSGKVEQIKAEELVPGDIVLLQEGDRIPADGRVILSANLQVEEAALTGESHGVFKQVDPIDRADVALGDRTNMVFMGTSVAYGRGEMVVTATGLRTELGKIAAMIMNVEEVRTPLQKRLDNLSTVLVRGALVIVAIVFVAGLLRGIPLEDMLLTAISLAVAAVPEGLPAIITISLSLGAARMVRRNALIRRLPAVETLGSVTVICSDKTGTLTRNEMMATQIALPGHDDVFVTGVGYRTEGEFLINNRDRLDLSGDTAMQRILKAMALATDAYLETKEDGSISVVGDTTEGALLVAAQKVGWSREFLERDMPRVAELPFSSDRKAMTTVHRVQSTESRDLFDHAEFVAITKGAPDRLLAWAGREHTSHGPVPLTDERRQMWSEQIDRMARRGLRVLGIAYRPLPAVPEAITADIERNLTLIGLVGIVDPARPEAKTAVGVARGAGIRPIMITGDHALTAEAIAADLTIISPEQKAVTGAAIERMSDEELTAALGRTSVFARVAPEHKMRIVRALQAQGEVVAMTGDGVNDAPALKQADIGIAMGITGTDVSKGAADMVLTDDNFASIVAAVEEGRLIYDNIRKFVLFLLSSNVGEILVMFIGILAGLPIPLLAIQILWVNLITDGLPAIALGFEPPEPDLMKRKPRPKTESIFAGGVGRRIIWRATLIAALTLSAFVGAHWVHGLDPFSATRGIEHLSREQLVALTGEAAAPADWDSLSLESRLDRLTTVEGTAIGHQEPENPILAAAERLPRTIAFTVLALGQIFHVIAIHAGEKELFFRVGFARNRFMLAAVATTFVLQFAVIYVPFLRFTFDTYPLSPLELTATVGVASLMFFAVELQKLVARRQSAAG